MKHLILKRGGYKDLTRGKLTCMNDNDVEFELESLELPWEGNEKQVSCIPVGVYGIEYRNSEKYGDHLIIEGVPNRSLILIHHGNYLKDTKGCVLVGLTGSDNEVWSSKDAMKKLMNWFGSGKSTITVT